MRALQALLCWVGGWCVSATRRRQALARAVHAHFGDAAVFSLGSGRSALAACLKAAGIGAGDEVLLSSYTCLAVPTAVIAAGARPVYVDINPDTLNVNADDVLAAMSPRVRAVVVQHTLGKAAPVLPIVEGARRRGVLVIEDCALSIGSRVGDRLVGTFGDAAFFSMELSKTLSSGWGGILVVHDRRLAAAVRALYATLPAPGRWCATRDLWQTAISAWCHQPALFHAVGKYVLFLGFKSGLFRRSTPAVELDGGIASDFIVKMGGAQAALARLQWRDLGAIAAACENHARTLRTALRQLDIPTPGAPGDGEVGVAPRVSFLVPDRQAAMAYFLARGIDLGEWFDGPLCPVPNSPVFNYDAKAYPDAGRVAAHVVNVPCHSRMTARDVAHVAATIREFAASLPRQILSL